MSSFFSAYSLCHSMKRFASASSAGDALELAEAAARVVIQAERPPLVAVETEEDRTDQVHLVEDAAVIFSADPIGDADDLREHPEVRAAEGGDRLDVVEAAVRGFLPIRLGPQFLGDRVGVAVRLVILDGAGRMLGPLREHHGHGGEENRASP